MPARRARPVEFARLGARDYVRALLYLVRENPYAAELFQTQIKQAMDLLHERPLIGRPSSRMAIRELVAGEVPYTLVYRVAPRRVVVLRVLHQSRMPGRR